jgi:hypothetical protein
MNKFLLEAFLFMCVKLDNVLDFSRTVAVYANFHKILLD